MIEDKWAWYASADQEHYAVGPCPTRESVIQAAIDERLGEDTDDVTGQWQLNFHIVEATQTLKLSSWLPDVDVLLEQAEESFQESEFASEDGEPAFEVTLDKQKHLAEAIKGAVDAWQIAYGVAFTSPYMFTATRKHESIVHKLDQEQSQ